VATRGRRYGSIAAIAVIGLFALGGLALSYGFIDGYRITSVVDPEMQANPLAKTTVKEAGSWLINYSIHPLLVVFPALGFIGALGALIGLNTRMEALTFLASKLSVVGIISTVGVSMFPFILPSSIQPEASLTVWDSSSSHSTLFNMLVVTVIFLPLILAYTAYVYRVLWGKVSEESVNRDGAHY
jgi:cytochrome d ubiquinol oxidase subunit II